MQSGSTTWGCAARGGWPAPSWVSQNPKLYKKEPEQRKTKPEHTTDIQQQTTSERALSTDSSCLICYVPSVRLIPYYYRAGGLQCHIGTGPTPNRPHTDLSTHRADRPESEYITNNCKSYGKSFRDVAGKVPRNITPSLPLTVTGFHIHTLHLLKDGIYAGFRSQSPLASARERDRQHDSLNERPPDVLISVLSSPSNRTYMRRP